MDPFCAIGSYSPALSAAQSTSQMASKGFSPCCRSPDHAERRGGSTSARPAAAATPTSPAAPAAAAAVEGVVSCGLLGDVSNISAIVSSGSCTASDRQLIRPPPMRPCCCRSAPSAAWPVLLAVGWSSGGEKGCIAVAGVVAADAFGVVSIPGGSTASPDCCRSSNLSWAGEEPAGGGCRQPFCRGCRCCCSSGCF